MAYVRQFGIILGVTFVAEIIRRLIPLPIPAGIYGMIIMLLSLKTGIIKLEQIKDAAYFLIGILQLIFIPATVGLIVSYAGFLDVLPQSVLIVIVSSVITIAVTGRVAQKIQNAAKGNGS